jgi:hypothetical protein
LPGVDEPISPARIPAAQRQATAALLAHAAQAPTVPADDPEPARVRAGAPPTGEATPLQVAVLGPVQLQGMAEPRRLMVRDILIYLALHRDGANAEQLATAVRPDEPFNSHTIRSRVLDARTLTGQRISKRTGNATTGWQLDASVGCDWQRFQALAAGSEDDQHAALALVRGRPFADYTGEWLHLEGLATEIEAAVVDLSLTVAEREFDRGNSVAAASAADAGLRGCRHDERIYRAAMSAAEALGATAKVRSLMNDLKVALDAEVEPEASIEPATEELHARLARQLRRAAS